ncbi:PREDICTED: serine protease persephone-like [Vollenhovia emeryi]|uniref:serine protease persephone-like n=1 Tax=Vollenhovia emeryi TaxID=411798 RepID=UPI0005F4DEA9|nr:PREDICTED: serine protease persephone-like [Vollenhovia emeryi]
MISRISRENRVVQGWSKMSTSLSNASSLLLLVLLSILLPTHGKHVGESCVIDNSQGQCKLIRDCPRVYEEILAGKAPNEICGFFGFDAIICCPTTIPPVRKQTPQPQTSDQANTTEGSVNLSETMESVTSSNMTVSAMDSDMDFDEDLDEDLDEDSDKDLDEDSDKDLDKDSDKDLDKDSDKDLDKDSDKDSDKDLNPEKELLNDGRKEATCVIDNSPGVCKLIEDCPQVRKELYAGKMPSVTCKCSDSAPTICCPTTNRGFNPSMLKPQLATSVLDYREEPLKFDKLRGSAAQARCADNLILNSMIPPPKIKSHTTSNKAEAKEFPYAAVIGSVVLDEIMWYCIGSLISSKNVLTAASCVWTTHMGSAKWVRLGDQNFTQSTDKDNTTVQTIAIKEGIRHPNYIPLERDHDIGILRLETDAIYNAFVRPVCLPFNWPDVSPDDTAIATGWGQLDWQKGEDPDYVYLWTVKLNLVSHEACNASFFNDSSFLRTPSGIVDGWHICAGQERDDICPLSGGGQLIVSNEVHKCMHTVIGVFSEGLCGTKPGVYTRVFRYLPWIERTAWPEYFETHNSSLP